jgi:2-succinyl-6-hydroxy-2,4-cyclohexadiene-1-carboxylate synthase
MPDCKTTATAPVVLALHGFTGGGADFNPLIDALPEIRHWTCPDLPGHGVAHNHPCNIESVMTYIHESSQRLPSPRIIMGYSMGARAAIMHAVGHPDYWQAMILISARSGISDDYEREQRRLLDEKRAQEIEALGLEHFLRTWQNQPLIRSQQNISSTIREQMAMTRSRHTASGLACSIRDFGQGNCPDATPELHALKMPVLLLAGSKDYNYQQYANQMLSLLPNASVRIINNAGHMPHLENPTAACAAIRTFVHLIFNS